jgi:hypothetical protein
VPAILKEIAYTELPVLEIISYEGDAGVPGSMDRLAEIGWLRLVAHGSEFACPHPVSRVRTHTSFED